MFELDFLQLRQVANVLNEHHRVLLAARHRVVEAGWQPDLLATQRQAELVLVAQQIMTEAERCQSISAELQRGIRIITLAEQFLVELSSVPATEPGGFMLRIGQASAVTALWKAATSAGQLASIALQTALIRRIGEFQLRTVVATTEGIREHPWLLFSPVLLFGSHIGHGVHQAFELDWQQQQSMFWAESYYTLELLLRAQQGSFEQQLLLSTIALGLFGWRDVAGLHQASVVRQDERRRRLDEYSEAVAELFGSDYVEQFIAGQGHAPQPIDLQQLVLGLGQLDYLGGVDEAVIRIAQRGQHPEQLILMLPSTQQWLPDSQIPNDALGNLTGIQGSSALVALADEAVAKHLYAQGLAVDAVEIIVVGFSQGGIAAAAFATVFADKYRIPQVVTAGSPIGKFTEIPKHTRVLALEAHDDPVPKLDGQPNPNEPQWRTHTRFQGSGSMAGAHNVFRYAEFAGELTATGEFRDAENLNRFFADDYRFTDYFGRRPDAHSSGGAR